METATVEKNSLTGYTGDKIDSAFLLGNAKAVKFNENTIQNVQKNGDQGLGAAAIMYSTFSTWTVDGSKNTITKNNGGIAIVTKFKD